MDIFQRLEVFLNSGDEEVRKWFLVESYYLPIVFCGCYVLFSTVVGPAIMKYREPFDLRWIMIIFNFSVVAVYLYIWAIVIWYLPGVGYHTFCHGASAVKGTVIYTLATAGWIVYIIKYVEYFDTVFFVLRKKNNLITFLHVVHHSVIPLAGWIMMRTEKSGFQSIPVLINAVVHIIMYTYYGLAAMGPQVRKYLWWKKYLTQLQMIQFILVLGFVLIVAPMSGCMMVGTSYILDMILASLFLVLFYKFYQTNFVQKRTADCKQEKEYASTIESEKKGAEMVENQLFTNGRTKKE